LLLALGDRPAAEAALRLLEETAGDDPETLRLSALTRVMAGDPQAALEIARTAQARVGHWIAIKRAVAVAHYASALTPALGPEWALSPNPFDRGLARQDLDAQAHLQHALTSLDSIADAGVENRIDQTYRLAILVNIDGRREDAVAVAEALLAEVPDDPMVVAWCAMRDLPVDLSQSRSALAFGYAAGTSIARVRALALLSAGADAAEMGSFLAAHIDAQSPDVREEAELWIARFQGSDGDVRSGAIRKAQSADDWEGVACQLASLLGANPPDPMGLGIAELAASASRWALLTPHIDALLRYRTATGVRLAVLAAVNAGACERALAILDAAGGSFGPSLPRDMRRIRADCLARTGQAATALLEANQLAASNEADADPLFLARMRARFGNIRPGIAEVRRALDGGSLQADEALQWSTLTTHADPNLARQLLLAAIEKGVRDDLVTTALDQAFRLGLDDKTGGLMAAMHQRAEAGAADVRTLSLDEVRAFLIEQQQAAVEDERRFLDGLVPIHLWAAHRPELVLAMFAGPAGDVLRPLLVRHGGRPPDWRISAPWSEWRIHLDVTGFLLAHRLGLLDRLEQHPNGLTISPHLPALLLQMQARVVVGQPSRIANMRAVLELAATDRLRTSFEPGAVRKMVRLSLAGEDAGFSLRGLASVLRAQNELEPEEAERLTAGLEEEKVSAPASLTSELLLDDLVLERFASLGLLERLAQRHAIAAPEAVLRGMRSEVDRYESGQELARIAGTLAERVGSGVETGIYRVLPVIDHDLPENHSALENALLDLIGLPPSDHAVLWTDDRCLTGFVNAGPHPIVGVLDALHAMLDAQEIGQSEHDRYIARLQSLGAVFVPSPPEQLARELFRASISEGRVVETPELARLRQSFAARRQLEPHLKVGPVPEGLEERPDEDAVARDSLRAFGDTLAEIWSASDIDEPRAEALSDWVYENILLLRLNRDDPALDTPEARLALKTLQVAHTLEKASDIAETQARRDAYLQWCWNRLVLPHQISAQAFVERVGAYLSEFYGALLDKPGRASEQDQLYTEIILRRRAEKLPDPVRDIVIRSGVFRRTIRFSLNATIGKLKFAPHRFWKAATAAFRYGPATLRARSGERITLSRDGKDLVVTGAVNARLPGLIPSALASRGPERCERLAGILLDLELRPELDAALRVQLLRKTLPEQIARYIAEAEPNSVKLSYKRLEQSLRLRRGTHSADLQPARIADLLHYFGLPADGRWHDQVLSNAVATLSERLGLLPALRRLSGLPVGAQPLGETGLDKDDAATMLRDAITATELIRAADLARAKGVALDGSVILTRFIEISDRWNRFHVGLLRWTWACLLADPMRPDLDPPMALALTWLHAGAVLEAFVQAGIKADKLHEAVPDPADILATADRLTLHTTGPVDPCDPMGLDEEALLFHAGSALLHLLGRELAEDTGAEALAQRWVYRSGENILPQPQLWFRFERADALGGYLGTHPPEWSAVPSIEQTRAGLVEQCLASIRSNPEDLGAWHLLGGALLRGATESERSALLDLFDSTDLIGEALAQAAGEKKLRLVLASVGWSRPEHFPHLVGTAARRLAECGATAQRTSRVLDEMIESAHLAALREPFGFDEELFASSLHAIADGYPDVGGRLRTIVAGLTVGLAPDKWPALWRLQLELQRRR
jgi:hypothetical protein